MKFYLAGPMSGYPDHNYPAFHRVATALREVGFDIVSPAELNIGAELKEPTEAVRLACMRKDLHALIDCDGILLMDGWQRSRGARIELQVALDLGLEVRFVDQLLDVQ